MDVHPVHAADVPLEGTERDPISGAEDGYGRVFGGGEEVGG